MKLTPKRVAQAIGVSESSMKRWCDRGLIECNKTAGGHRRVSRTSLIRFLRSSNHEIHKPELLGLPAGTQRNDRTVLSTIDFYTRAINDADAAGAERILVECYLEGQNVAEIADNVIQPALTAVQTNNIAQYARPACQISAKALIQFGNILPTPRVDAPTAISARDGDDEHQSLLVDMVLREIGWNSHSVRVQPPWVTLSGTARAQNSKLVALFISDIDSKTDLVASLHRLQQSLIPGSLLVIRGAVPHDLSRRMTFCRFADDLQRFRATALSLCEALSVTLATAPSQSLSASGNGR